LNRRREWGFQGRKKKNREKKQDAKKTVFVAIEKKIWSPKKEKFVGLLHDKSCTGSKQINTRCGHKPGPTAQNTEVSNTLLGVDHRFKESGKVKRGWSREGGGRQNWAGKSQTSCQSREGSKNNGSKWLERLCSPTGRKKREQNPRKSGKKRSIWGGVRLWGWCDQKRLLKREGRSPS